MTMLAVNASSMCVKPNSVAPRAGMGAFNVRLSRPLSRQAPVTQAIFRGQQSKVGNRRENGRAGVEGALVRLHDMRTSTRFSLGTSPPSRNPRACTVSGL